MSTIKKLSKVKQQLQGIRFNNVDLAHVMSLYLASNNETLREQKEISDSKIISITKELNSNDPKKIIFHFLSLSNSVKLLLSKRLNFALPKNKIEYSNYLVYFDIMLKI